MPADLPLRFSFSPILASLACVMATLCQRTTSWNRSALSLRTSGRTCSRVSATFQHWISRRRCATLPALQDTRASKNLGHGVLTIIQPVKRHLRLEGERGWPTSAGAAHSDRSAS
uniref:Uncharacterized protein n=1 Tax=Sphingomonas sp. KSM1 TaxID=1228049 RepID=M1VHK6_9SPHN|nr:hypothetical protein [Sphingomonas sp. KSM1]